jgi:diguanylate cyclase (GGDEF)-like protein
MLHVESTDEVVMHRHTIGIYGGRADLLSALQQHCPGADLTFDPDARGRCRVAIFDSDSHALLDERPRRSLARIVLIDGPVPDRSEGDLQVPRASFLANSCPSIAFAADLADVVIHASQLESEISYLTQIHELMTMSDAEAVSERITRTLLNILGLAQGTLFLHDPRLERYVVSFTNDPDTHDTGEFLPGVPPDLLQKALASGRSFAVDRSEHQMIVMPLQVGHDLVGIIKVRVGASDTVDEESTSNVTRYLTAVAGVLGNVYQLTRSRELALRDDLTKAYNRRFFESHLDEEIERSRRYGSIFSIIFLDLDDLKTVNNKYGHLMGSRTLQEVAKRILGAVRGIDKVVRFGGDEFCIILPQTDPDQAAAVARRVQRSLSVAPFHLDANIDISITASFGIASYPNHAVTKDNLIRQADAAMYAVKSTTKDAIGVAAVEDATRPIAQPAPLDV